MYIQYIKKNDCLYIFSDFVNRQFYIMIVNRLFLDKKCISNHKLPMKTVRCNNVDKYLSIKFCSLCSVIKKTLVGDYRYVMESKAFVLHIN